jgi:hypothetical protein
MSKKGYQAGSGNVFKDLGIPNAEGTPVQSAACVQN